MVIAIYGLGLIGGSLGRAIVEKTSHTVLGFDIDNYVLDKAKALSAYHFKVDDENIKTADLVILALNPSTAISVMSEIVPKLKENSTVIDCCGNKRQIVAKMESLSNKYRRNFIGVHPMAGKEHSGISHSTPKLFENAYFIMTPLSSYEKALTNNAFKNKESYQKALLSVEKLFYDIGCKGVVKSTAKNHDRIIAYTSQLAHIVSSSYIKSPVSAEHIGFSAGSFKDMTRVAKLDSTMWAELFMENRDNLINEITILEKHLSQYKQALIGGSFAQLKSLLDDGVQKKEIADKLKKESLLND